MGAGGPGETGGAGSRAGGRHSQAGRGKGGFSGGGAPDGRQGLAGECHRRGRDVAGGHFAFVGGVGSVRGEDRVGMVGGGGGDGGRGSPCSFCAPVIDIGALVSCEYKKFAIVIPLLFIRVDSW